MTPPTVISPTRGQQVAPPWSLYLCIFCGDSRFTGGVMAGSTRTFSEAALGQLVRLACLFWIRVSELTVAAR